MTDQELSKILRPQGVKLYKDWDGKNQKIKNLILVWTKGTSNVSKVKELLSKHKESGSFFTDEVKQELKEEKKVVDKAPETKKEEPVSEEPKVEETKVEEPVAAEPVVEETKVEEPVAAEPVVEEGVGQEPEATTEEPQVEAEVVVKKTTKKKKSEE